MMSLESLGLVDATFTDKPVPPEQDSTFHLFGHNLVVLKQPVEHFFCIPDCCLHASTSALLLQPGSSTHTLTANDSALLH